MFPKQNVIANVKNCHQMTIDNNVFVNVFYCSSFFAIIDKVITKFQLVGCIKKKTKISKLKKCKGTSLEFKQG
jgi:hypothetical protein